MKAKAFISLLLVSFLIFAAGCGNSGTSGSDSENSQNTSNQGGEKQKVVKLGITQIVEHPSLDAAREGFLAALKDNGYIEGENLEVDLQIAQGDPSNNLSIAQSFASNKKDLILAIATDSAQAVAKAIKDTPILFTAITDPLGAGLVADLQKPGGNVTGTSDTHPEAIAKTMEFIAKEFPHVKTVGIVANEGEQNSLVNVQKAEAALKNYNIQVVKASAAETSEVKQAAESLVGRCDVIYIPKDNTVVSALEAVIQVAQENDIPLIVGEKDSVKRGGFAGFGFEYFDLGYTTGLMALQILEEGKSPADIPVGFPETLDLAINLKAAKEMGITVTDSMKAWVEDQENNIIQ